MHTLADMHKRDADRHFRKTLDLSYEIGWLKGTIKTKDREIAARDSEIDRLLTTIGELRTAIDNERDLR